jgi:protein-tyrosine phosphatase
VSLDWIRLEAEGRLAIRPLPRVIELMRWRKAGAELVVNLTEPREAPSWSGERERHESVHQDLRHRAFPIPDFGLPADEAAFERLARELVEELDRGTNVVIHCRGGKGRSSLLAASVLALRGLGLEEALERIAESRPGAGPETPEQRAWLGAFVARLTHG